MAFHAAGAGASGTTGTVTPALPTGWVPDDIFICFVETSNQAVTASAGWTEVPSSPQGTGTAGGTTSASVRLTAFWKRAASGDVGPTISGTTEHKVAIVTSWRSAVLTGDPFHTSAGGILAAANTAFSIPGLTTTVDRCMIVDAIANATDTATAQTTFTTNTSVTNHREVADFNATAGGGGGVGVAASTKDTAGAVSATAGTLTTSSAQGMMKLALLPGPVLPKLATLTDNFEDTTRDAAKWDLIVLANDALRKGATIAETGSVLRTTLLSGTTGTNYAGYTAAAYHDIASSSFYSRMLFSNTAGTNGVPANSIEGALVLGVLLDRRYIFTYFESNLRLMTSAPGATTYSLVGSAFTYVPADMRWVRIRVEGTRIYADTAPDNADATGPGLWTNKVDQPVLADLSITHLKAGVIAGTYASVTNAGTIDFDGFNTTTTAPAVAERVYKGSAGEAIVRVGSAPLSTYYLGSTGLWP